MKTLIIILIIAVGITGFQVYRLSSAVYDLEVVMQYCDEGVN